MPKKPIIIICISLCYLIAPVFIILQASVTSLYPIVGPVNIFMKLSIFDWLILGMYVVAAVSVFSIRRWGWYLFNGVSVLLIGTNITVYFIRPYYAAGLLILYNLAFTAAAGILFRKTLIAPYFNPQIRWWSQSPRYKLSCYAEVGYPASCVRAGIVDISEHGIYLLCEKELDTHAPLPVSIRCLDYRILVDAKVVRSNPAVGNNMKSGYGLKFIHVSAIEKKALYSMIRRLKTAGLIDSRRVRFAKTENAQKHEPRFKIQITAILSSNGSPHPVELLDLSADGCMIQLAPEFVVSVEQPVHLGMTCFASIAEIDGTIRWIRQTSDCQLIGISFNSVSDSIKKILKTGKKSGMQNRLKTASPLPEEKLHEYALNSPYKIVHAVKTKLIKGK